MKIAIAGATGLIGTKLANLAREEGHEVVALSRRGGFDLTDSASQEKLIGALAEVEAVIDVTQGTDFEEAGAVAFFRAVGANLGDAARAAEVKRTVVLSIVGIERSPDYGYYVGKVAHERAHREHSPDVCILRATQFHEFAGQMIDWYTTDGVASVMDVDVQPVDSAEVVRALLDLATRPDAGDLQLSGPQRENLLDLASRVAAQRGDVVAKPGEAPASMAAGAMLPQPEDHAVVRGVTWQQWFDAQ